MGAPRIHDLVDVVRSAGDLVRLVSDYVPLRQRGSRLVGLCPFHQEKTPSFSVDPDQQLFYCFGCHTGGDAFKFVMLYEKVDFREAVELLARRWGVEVPQGPASAADALRTRILEMNAVAESFFRGALAHGEGGRRGREALARRGLSEDTVDRLRLGYAPDSWEALGDHLAARRFSPEERVSAGLALPRKTGSGVYDRFRDRLIFPIRDASGKTLAFGGRALGDAEPKYLNSPETSVYVKGDHLYGLDLAKEAIRREGFAVVVEGYMDLAAVVQAGMSAVVATLGTSFTAAQVRLLARHTERVIVSYDGDAAGVTATARSLDLLLAKGFHVRVLDLPPGTDPDDLIREEGAESYLRRLRQAPGYLEFLLRREVSTRDLDRVEERVAAVNALLPHLARLGSPIERGSWARQLADALRLEDELILQELRAALRQAQPRIRQRATEPALLRPAESGLVLAVLEACRSGKRDTIDLVPADLEGLTVAAIVHTILRLAEEDREVGSRSVFEALDREADRDLFARIAFHEHTEANADDVETCLQVLRRERLMGERRQLQREIERAADPSATDALLLRKQELARRIDALS